MGVAFLVTADLLVTCAHVATAAVGQGRFDREPPTEPTGGECWPSVAATEPCDHRI